MKTPKKLYQFHVANLREIDHAMDKIARSLRASISQSDEPTVSAFMRLYALLLGTWAECRLRKLIYEPQGFDGIERETIQADDLPRKIYPSKMRVERPKKEQLSHEPTQTRTNRSIASPS